MNQGTKLGSQIGRWIILAALVVALGALLLTIRPAGAQEAKTYTYAENGTRSVAAFNATAQETGGKVYWSLGDADDEDHFSISPTKGGRTVLSFKESPDYEDSKGGTGDNSPTYTVKLYAGDGGNPSDHRNLHSYRQRYQRGRAG